MTLCGQLIACDHRGRRQHSIRVCETRTLRYLSGMDISEELADRVMRLVVSADYRPAKPKKIAEQLKLDPDDYRELRRVIKQLVLEGRLVYGSNHLVLSTGSVGGPSDRVRGTFRRAMGGGGFGFLRPGDGGGEGASEIPDDIFVPPGSTGGALAFKSEAGLAASCSCGVSPCPGRSTATTS